MTEDTFKGLVLTQNDGQTQSAIESLTLDRLPEGDVVVDVTHSSVNYKDGLAVTGKGKIVREFPHVPGIDLAGTVASSQSPRFKAGDRVVLTGWGVGESHWGGYAQKARVRSEWLTPLPSGLSLEQAMSIGTAGFTAMLCVMALEEGGLETDAGSVLVTGASGGVGSLAVALLARGGYTVSASTGRSDSHEYLRALGASELIERGELDREPKPLEKQRWAGAVDTVGGQTLATALTQMHYGASVAACGLAGGVALPTSVMPFILRAVSLRGVDSVMCPPARREKAWKRLADELDPDKLASMSQTVGLAEVPAMAAAILKGQVRGRVVVDVNS